MNGSTAATAWRVAHVELRADTDTVFETMVDDGGRDYDAYPRTYTATRRSLFQLLAATTTRVTGEAARNGTTVYRIEAVDIASPTLLAGAEGVEAPGTPASSHTSTRRGSSAPIASHTRPGTVGGRNV